MKINIFLSHPKPMMKVQAEFIDALARQLEDPYGLVSHALGRESYDMDAPMTAIRRLMLECNGVLVVAFRRYWVDRGHENHGCDITGVNCKSIAASWMTSPWCHIEAAMGFQLGLPLMVLREKGVIADGLLDRGVRGANYPEFELGPVVPDFITGPLFKSILPQWSARVRNFRESRGMPGPFAG